VLPALERNGISPFAISYDSVAILAAFAAKHGIRYPLLSDEGSHTLRRLGLINERVHEDHAAYGIQPNPRHLGVPYPGVFVLNELGVVVRKRFHESYRERDTGAGLLAQALGILDSPHGAETAASGPTVRVRAWLDSPTYSVFQRLHLSVELTIAPGLHVYGAPAPDGATALSLDVSPIDGLELRPMSWPEPRRLRVAGVGEEIRLHEGTIRGTLPFAFTAPAGAGAHRLTVVLSYQACSDTVCYPPDAVRLELPVKEIALVDRTLPNAKS
jgi:Disulphide bond corrector protein DsbC/AhpC/TSA family